MDIFDCLLALGSQSSVSLVRLGLDRGAESVVVVNQQLQTRLHDRGQTGFLEVVVLGDEDVDVLGDRFAGLVSQLDTHGLVLAHGEVQHTQQSQRRW
jgi:hypothetical protein